MWAALRELANFEELSFGETVRSLIRDALKKRCESPNFKIPPIIEKDTFFNKNKNEEHASKLARKVSVVGSNLDEKV